MRTSLVITSLFTLISAGLYAQDTHYWSKQFGTRSALMGGAVLGDSDDNTMIYYNPAALGFLENASISINANAYQIENIRVENALGERGDFESGRLGSVPLLAGGMIRTGNPRWKLGFAFVSPVDFRFKGIARVDGNFDLVDTPDSPGLEETVAETGITSRTSELIFALGVARQLSDHWAVGLSNLFTVRNHDYQRNFSTYIFLNDPGRTLIGSNVAQNAAYYNVRYAAKLGIVYQKAPWKAGLTVTTPSLNMFGQGTVASNIALQNVRLEDREEPVSGVGTDRQSELKTTFKSPLSVALGANYEKGRSSIGLAVQYFSGLDIYDVMDPAPGSFVRPVELAPEIQSDEFLNLQSGAESVINMALGYEYQLSDSFSLLGSLRSDMSYYDDDINDNPGIKSTISSWDIYHFTAGFSLDRENSSLSLGLLFSAGVRDDYEQNGSFDPANPDILIGARTVTEARYSSIGILFGYTYYFKKFRLKGNPGQQD